jgi:MoxR-like ATPase
MNDSQKDLDETKEIDPIIWLLNPQGRRIYEYSNQTEREILSQNLQQSQVQYFLEFKITDDGHNLVVECYTSVGESTVSQEEWYLLFRTLKKNKQARSLFNEMLNARSGEETAKCIDDLGALKIPEVEVLFGETCSGLNAILTINAPFENVSILSLQDRIKILSYFGIKVPETPSIGNQIIETNNRLKLIPSVFGSTMNTLQLAEFLRLEEVRSLWDKFEASTFPSKLFIVNIKPEHWETCKKKGIYGVRRGTEENDLPPQNALFLVRLTGQESGVYGVWQFLETIQVTPTQPAPWQDADYSWILKFKPLVNFKIPFKEEFGVRSRFSEKVQISAQRLHRALIELTHQEAESYISALLNEKLDDLHKQVDVEGTKELVYLNELLSQIGEKIQAESFFVLRIQRENELEDLEKHVYHFNTNFPNYNKIRAGTRLLFDRIENNKRYFLGFGTCRAVVDLGKRETEMGKEVLQKRAEIINFVKFFPRFESSEVLEKRVKEVSGYYEQHPIRPTSKEIFTHITQEAPKLGWNFNVEEAIDEILSIDSPRYLAIPRKTIEKIITHLRSGKHVVLQGPPGVGKTDLAQRIAKGISRRVIGQTDIVMVVASSDWGRKDIIGEPNPQTGEFHEGCMSLAIRDEKWLIIDEFNRTDLNKTFGELLTAVEYGKVILKPEENPLWAKEMLIMKPVTYWLEPVSMESEFIIPIPADFRLICTMNTFDKETVMARLPYGVLTRFAFVEIEIEEREELAAALARICELLAIPTTTKVAQTLEMVLQVYCKFIQEVRKKRIIGVRTTIDVGRYVATCIQNGKDPFESLGEALTDYVLPQFERLGEDVLGAVLRAYERAFINEAKTESSERFRKEIAERIDALGGKQDFSSPPARSGRRINY